MSSTITQEDRDFVETWEHISPQRWGITRLGPAGDYRSEVIVGQRNFMLTTAERVITQDRIREEALDPFLNGSFRPVVVPDSVTIKSNPNALSDEEIFAILNTESALAWEENVGVIDSVATLRRMLDLADQSDITVKRYRQLESRLEEVRGIIRLEYDDPALRDFLQPRAVKDSPTAEAPPAKKRTGGGRSRDYRDDDSTTPKPSAL